MSIERLLTGHGMVRSLDRPSAQPPFLTRISHQLPAATCDAPHPAVFSRLGVLSPPTTAQSGRGLAPRRAHRTRTGGGETQAPEARRNVPQVRAPRPARSGWGPQYCPLRAPWVRILGAATTAMSFIAEERQRRSRGHAAATLWADGGRGRSLRCSSSTMLGHRLPPRALISTHETHRRTALGTPAEPLGREPHWARHLGALATKPGEICGPSVEP